MYRRNGRLYRCEYVTRRAGTARRLRVVVRKIGRGALDRPSPATAQEVPLAAAFDDRAPRQHQRQPRRRNSYEADRMGRNSIRPRRAGVDGSCTFADSVADTQCRLTIGATLPCRPCQPQAIVSGYNPLADSYVLRSGVRSHDAHGDSELPRYDG
ncbi:hypothetical protein DAEQUDRAFT_13596 [Daedalea quercina L-15889]|uniref:Uncharacterized protein n=1 Tax=Daedalea quercina L-15889 TaxID=1314783 RepID=A0A165UHR9_9APHY|nr:hypothetical protein DAEQUDRAFT_13596 [Daedalea quercina L-15889]